jgi:hypothetical protein
MEGEMSLKTFSRGVLTAFLCAALATPMGAQGIGDLTRGAGRIGPSKGTVIGILAGVVAAVVIVVVLLKHKKKITGCVNADANGMRITDERDNHTYSLSGNTADIKPGDRVILQGEKIKSKEKGGVMTWRVDKLTSDLGSCRP